MKGLGDNSMICPHFSFKCVWIPGDLSTSRLTVWNAPSGSFWAVFQLLCWIQCCDYWVQWWPKLHKKVFLKKFLFVFFNSSCTKCDCHLSSHANCERSAWKYEQLPCYTCNFKTFGWLNICDNNLNWCEQFHQRRYLQCPACCRQQIW